MPTAGSSLCLAQPGRDGAVTGDKHGYCTHHRPLMRSAVSGRGWPRYRFLKQPPLALYVITLHSLHGSQNCRTVASSFISGRPTVQTRITADSAYFRQGTSNQCRDIRIRFRIAHQNLTTCSLPIANLP